MWTVSVLWFVLSAPVHGAWVYKRAGLDERRVDLIVAARERLGLTEIYVSLGALPLEDAATPSRIKRFKRAGLRVEALIDGPAAKVQATAVLRFNRAQTDESSRFDGIHYDFEPWIGSGESTAWVEVLTEKYAEASNVLAGSKLPLSVDVSGAKLSALPLETQDMLRRSATKLVLMQYETPPERVMTRSESLFERRVENGAPLIIALRVQDFGCEVLARLQQLELRWRDQRSYGGWALFDLDAYTDKCLRLR